MDWKTVLATIAFLGLVLFQAKMNEENSSSPQTKETSVKSSVLQRTQASMPLKHK